MSTVSTNTPSTILKPKTARFSEPIIQHQPLSSHRTTAKALKDRSLSTPSYTAKKFPNRIEKSRSSFGRRIEIKPSAVEQLAEHLEERREQLHDQVDKRLTEVRDTAKTHVEELSNVFERRLNLLRAAEHPLRSIISEELLEVTVMRNGQDGETAVEHHNITLRKRATEFQQLLKDKHGKLTELIDQWTHTQKELLQMAVEILGLERLELKKEQAYPELIAALKAGDKERTRIDEQHQEVLLEVEQVEREVKDVAVHTKDSIAKLTQQIRQDHLTQIRKLNHSLKEFTDGA